MTRLIKRYLTGGQYYGNYGYNSGLTGNSAYEVQAGLPYGQGLSGQSGQYSNLDRVGNILKKTTSSIVGKVADNIGNNIAKEATAAGAKVLSKQGAKAIAAGGIKGATAGALKGAVNPMALGGAAFDIAGSLLGNKAEYAGDKGALTQGLDKGWDYASDAVAVIPGFGTALSLGMKAAAFGTKAMQKWTGSGTDGMTTADALLGSTIGQLTPIGLINGWKGKKAHDMSFGSLQDQSDLSNQWSGYSGALSLDQTASHKAGKKYGMLSSGARKTANNQIDNANMHRAELLSQQQSANLGNIKGNNMVTINNMNYEQALNGGIDANRMYAGKTGLKLPTISDINKIKTLTRNQKTTTLKQWAKQKSEDIPQPILNDIHDVTKAFKEGGKIADWEPVSFFQNGGQVNVIPEGALHARLNNMQGAGDTITKKGIPVVDKDGNQQAEIEKNEIIFRKEVTDKIEKLADDGSEEAAIECGKLLTKEILENTDDRTGLIQANKKGGILKVQDGTTLDPSKLVGGANPPKGADSLTPDIKNIPAPKAPNLSKENKSIATDATKQGLVNAAGGMIDGVISGIQGLNQRKQELKQQQLNQFNSIIDKSRTLEKQNQNLYNQNNVSLSHKNYGTTSSSLTGNFDTPITVPKNNTTETITSKPITLAQEGTKLSDEQVSKIKSAAEKQNPPFLQRILNNNKQSIVIPIINGEKNTYPSTHLMVSQDNYAYPLVQLIKGKLVPFIDDKGKAKFSEAFKSAIENKNYIKFDTPEEANWYAENYKQFYPEYFKQF